LQQIQLPEEKELNKPKHLEQSDFVLGAFNQENFGI